MRPWRSDKMRPRLTSVLRILHTENQKPIDIQKLWLKRRSVLRARVNTEMLRNDTNSNSGGKRLTWDIFSKGKETSSRQKRIMRSVFKDMIDVVQKLVGDDIVGQELEETIFILYEKATKGGKANTSALAFGKVPQDLIARFGKLDPFLYHELCKLAIKLYSWRGEWIIRDNNSSNNNNNNNSTNENDEYGVGNNISFGFLNKHNNNNSSNGQMKNVNNENHYNKDLYQLLNINRLKNVLRRKGSSENNNHNNNFTNKISAGNGIDSSWLISRCEKHIHTTQQAGAACDYSSLELASMIMSTLTSSHAEGQIQTEIFNLLGEHGFSLVQEIFDNRENIISQLKGVDFSSNLQRGYISSSNLPQYIPPKSKSQDGPGINISVESAADKKARKFYRKEIRRLVRSGISEQDAIAMLSPDDHTGNKSNNRNQKMGISGNNGIKNGGFQTMAGNGGGLDFAAAMKAKESHEAIGRLPSGTKREKFKGYEEVYVPAPDVSKMDPNPYLVPITEFPDWAQLGFRGMKSLNRMQSQVYKTAFLSSENILICAPTGAGKTNVAMMTVLKQIGSSMVNGVIQKENLKMVYVAPMKALAQEVVTKFSKRLAPLGIQVKELTGDMQLTKREIAMTQMIVTTPEKWDVVTRKGGSEGLAGQVKLLIIDEVHLLADDRGAVIETLVARTLRLVETSQSMIRIVGLSATLPNYQDVATFLRVNLATGLFYFDGKWRPVPLETRYIGVSVNGQSAQRSKMNEIAYVKAIESIKKGNQVMIFVHSRKDTVKTGQAIAENARKNGTLGLIEVINPDQGIQKRISKSRNGDMQELFKIGIGIHHAGMLRSDRNTMEDAFAKGCTKILVCTATLAWGVNLPAHTVCIKGTEIYDSEKGGMKELGILDVQQIFGRAGRPQYDTSGEGIIITSHQMLNRYLAMMTRQKPIESQFTASIIENLNAEIVGGTVTNVQEAVTWLSYTYLFVRMMKNPMVYGITYEEKQLDHRLLRKRTQLIQSAAKQLDDARMVRYDARSGNLAVTDLGRVASHYYLKHETIVRFNKDLKPHMSMKDTLHLICSANELENVRVRDEELKELDTMKNKAPYPVKGGVENPNGKCNVLLQAHISRFYPRAFTLVSDGHYVAQNAARVTRGLFEICLKRGWPGMSETFLTLSKSIDKRVWWEPIAHPLRQFERLSLELVRRLEERDTPMGRLYDLSASEIGALVHSHRMGDKILDYVRQFPGLDIQVNLLPITRSILRVELEIYPDFIWSDRNHGTVQPFWIWMEDSENNHIYHSEYLLITKKQYVSEEPLKLIFTVPIFEPLPSQYYIRAESDRWVGASHLIAASFENLVLPDHHSPYTELLDLRPLSIKALQNYSYESLFKWTHFNPVQTQLFPTVYHGDKNILLGAPTGSGKTVVAELAMMRLWRTSSQGKIVYIAPLKALARERHLDWKKKYSSPSLVVKNVVQLTGDVTPDIMALKRADIIITTPEKWDGVSRYWHRRSYVQKVELVIIDEIHLLGEDRGPVLEAVVSRMRNISTQIEKPIRLVGLSTALANARDLATWMGIRKVGLYNFRPSVRPVPLEVHISGFPGKHYCPRMATMNKPTYASIMRYSPTKPVLVFVSSRRQTRLTALDLISFCASQDNPRQFLNMSEEEVNIAALSCNDKALKDVLPFGIGIHHGGLNRIDREIVEKCFLEGKIQILVCTSTLAWGVNFPAHLVVIKGTEFFDGKLGRYVDYAITDVLQMMGRAGRPQFDKEGVACVLIHEPKKNFYKKFLYEPFPVESKLLKGEVLHNHINAEIAGGTIASEKDVIEYLTWTYMFRRLLQNPTFYGLQDSKDETIEKFLLELGKSVFHDLEDCGCVEAEGEGGKTLSPLPLGRIASYYYLSFRTPFLFYDRINGSDKNNFQLEDATRLLSDAPEFDEMPVRHNEDKLNLELSKFCQWETDSNLMDDPHTKTFLLLQGYFFGIKLPMSDYITDTKSVMDQAMRVANAMVDVAAYSSNLNGALAAISLIQHLKDEKKYIPKVKEIMMETNVVVCDDDEDDDDTLQIILTRRDEKVGRSKKKKNNKYSTSWWLILGNYQTNTLYAIERFSFNKYKLEVTREIAFDSNHDGGGGSRTCILISDLHNGVYMHGDF